MLPQVSSRSRKSLEEIVAVADAYSNVGEGRESRQKKTAVGLQQSPSVISLLDQSKGSVSRDKLNQKQSSNDSASVIRNKNNQSDQDEFADEILMVTAQHNGSLQKSNKY